MKRFIKIFTTLAGLTLMTACGNTQGLIDALTAAVSTTDRTAVICVQNPFNALCDGNATYQSTRDTIERSCIANPNTSDNCVNFVAFLCIRDNPYHDICTQGENDYSTIQNRITSECITNGEGPLCDRAIAAVCTNNAFDPLCLTDLANEYNQGALVAGGQDVIGFSAARALVCDPVTGSAPDSQRCGSLVRATCDRNPLDALCENRAEYFVARDNACWIQGIDGSTRTPQCVEIHRENNLRENAIPACQANYVDPTGANRFNPRCYRVVIGVCDLNPFDVLCDKNTNYLELHAGIIKACTDEEPDATFCVQAKTSVCADNPFNPICLISYTENTNDYTSERLDAIANCQTNFVTGERCAGAAVQFCTGKTDLTALFNPLCLAHPGTDTARQPTCLSDRVADTPISARCTETATRICDARPLDPLCEDLATYRSAQFGACVLTPTHASCANGPAQFSYITPIIECLQSPFSAACLDPDTVSGAAFALHARVAQDAYCESGGPRTASTTVATRADRVNCSNIGSSPVFADLARNITQNGITTYNSGGGVTANGVTPQNPNIGGFLRAGVSGAKLGIHTGNHGAHLPNGGTYDQNTGNFDRETNVGNKWLGFGDAYSFGGDRLRIWDVASKADPKDGFTYFTAEANAGGNYLAYAGIWQTTNFGAPLALRPADDNGNITAIWQGNFTAFDGSTRTKVVPTVVDVTQVGAIYRRPINSVTTPFYVDFTAGTFSVHNTVANDGTGAVYGYTFDGSAGSQARIETRIAFDVDGYFGAGVTDPNDANRTLNAGELSGTVTRATEAAIYAPSNGDLTFGTDPSPIIMPLTGLIGVEGAVGIFLNPNPTSAPDVGGFTATAPTN